MDLIFDLMEQDTPYNPRHAYLTPAWLNQTWMFIVRGAGGYVPNFADLNRADAMRELEGMRKYGRGYTEADLTRTGARAGLSKFMEPDLKNSYLVSG